MTNKINEIPHMCIGNNELGDKAGKTTICPNCNKQHPIEYGKSRTLLPDGTYTDWKKSDTGVVKCGDISYLVVISGKLIK